MCMCEQWRLHCTSPWGWQMFSGHVCCVTVRFKMTERVEQSICIRFCIKLEHSLAEIICVIQMGNWWLAASSQQHAHSCVTSHAEFFGETSIHPSDSVPLQPRFGTVWLLVFPKTKISFEREKISDHQWDSGKYNRIADGNWVNCVRSQGAYFEGDWGVIVLCTMFLVSCIFFNKCLYFSCYMAGYFLDGHLLYICTHIHFLIKFM